MRQNVSRVKCVLIGLFVNGSLHYNESIAAFNQGPVVQKPVNAKLGLNLLNLGLNFNPRLLCVVQS